MQFGSLFSNFHANRWRLFMLFYRSLYFLNGNERGQKKHHRGQTAVVQKKKVDLEESPVF